MDDYVILDLNWDRQTVKDRKGNVVEILRGIDYDLDWIKMGESFAKFEKMIFKYEVPCFLKLKKIVDIETFDIVLSNDNGRHYFKDKSNVYIKLYNQEFVLEAADPNTFSVIDIEKGLAKDAYRYYYFEKVIPFNLSEATILNDYYTKAIGKIFFCFEEMAAADSESFIVLYQNVGKDKNHVYFKGQTIAGADSDTFHLIEECINGEFYERMDYTLYAKDKAMAYFIDTTYKEVKPIKSKSLNQFGFEVIDEKGVGFDNEYRYYYGKRKKK